MFISAIPALLNDPTAPHGPAEPVVRLLAGIGALVMTGIIIFRRKARSRSHSDGQ